MACWREAKTLTGTNVHNLTENHDKHVVMCMHMSGHTQHEKGTQNVQKDENDVKKK